ncbi:MAG: hypothetical protein FIA94_05830 [Nitrospirae bacterium]|nr:hypothetical protein [Nitrospirota bacterium]
MSENPEASSAVGGGQRCLDIALQPAASDLKSSDGKEISFTRAVLTVRNVCEEAVLSIFPHATLGQESGTVQDVTAVFARSVPASLSPGGTITCDVYDVLLPAHPGTASKIHMFGYRAALNWKFDLAVWIEYRASGSAAPARTPVSRWIFSWSIAETDEGNIELTIKDMGV